jgi:hypothetical protein
MTKITPHLSWLIALLPLACGCSTCDMNWLCFGLAVLAAAGLYCVLAIIRELSLFSSMNLEE